VKNIEQKFEITLLSEKEIKVSELEEAILKGNLTPWNIIIKKLS